MTSNREPGFQPNLMTSQELASYLNVSERTIYEWVQRDTVPAFKLGAAWRFRRDEIDAWLETQRSGPQVGGMTGQCSVCSSKFTNDLLSAGGCAFPDCANPICQTCWGTLNRKYCPAHRALGPSGSDAEDKAANKGMSRDSSGKHEPRSPGAASLGSTRFLDGFVHRVESRPHLLCSNGVPIVRVNNWQRVKLTGGDRSPAPSPRPRRPQGRHGREIRIGLWTAYRLRVPAGKLGETSRDLRLEARCIVPAVRRGRGRRPDPRPVGLGDLELLLTEARDLANAENVLYVLGLYAPQGWSVEAKALFNNPVESERFLNPNLSVAVVGSGLSEVLWNANDVVVQEDNLVGSVKQGDEGVAMVKNLEPQPARRRVLVVSQP